jgi:hypothetical protein
MNPLERRNALIDTRKCGLGLAKSFSTPSKIQKLNLKTTDGKIILKKSQVKPGKISEGAKRAAKVYSSPHPASILKQPDFGTGKNTVKNHGIFKSLKKRDFHSRSPSI